MTVTVFPVRSGWARWFDFGFQLLLVLLVASLFTVAFYESWAALYAAAVAVEMPDPRPWPWMVDGFIIAMALMVVQALRAGASRWDLALLAPRIGLVFATGLSTGIQAAWAPVADWAWPLHAWSPLAVLFSFECLLRLLPALAAATSQLRDSGSPGQVAGDVPRFGGQPSPPERVDGFVPGIRSGVVGTPPPSIPQTVAANVVDPESGEGGSLSDEPRPVTPVATPPTDRGRTVTTAKFKPEDIEALRRTYKQKKKDPVARFEEVIAARGLDRDAAWAMARRNHWPVANGHRKVVPA